MSVSTRLSLLEALKNSNDSQAWERFAQRYQGVVRAWAIRWGLARGLKRGDATDVADDVTQVILLTIRKRMRTYDIEKWKRTGGGYRRWLNVVVHHEVVGHLRARCRERGRGDSAVDELLDQVEAPDDREAREDLAEAMHAQTLDELLQHIGPQVCARVKPRDWDIALALGLTDGRQKHRPQDGPARPTAQEVAERFNVTRSAVYQAKFRVIAAITEIVRPSAAAVHS